jgi:thiol-disulfide isomerase/thioredoxin
MKTKKNIIVLFYLLLTATFGFGQNKMLQLEIEGKNYDNLSIRILPVDPANFERFVIEGESTNGSLWTFIIPDTISQDIRYIDFHYRLENQSYNDRYGLIFTAILGTDTLKSYVCNFENNSDTLIVKGKFSKAIAYDDELWVGDSIITGNYHYDLLEVVPKEKSYLMENMQYPFFCAFYDPGDEDKQYEDLYNEYLLRVKENPESIYFAIGIAGTMPIFESIDDLKKIYDCFSPSIKNSGPGKFIYQYFSSKENFLNSTFENSVLPLWNLGIPEAIIQDTSKINLVIFTASWCRPCREEIPLLKEIYADLKEDLIMTYVSVDEAETVVTWRELMQKETIRWRSVLAVDNVEGIRKKYHADGIPYTLLVYPSGYFETMDVRNDAQREKLYSLCGKN